MEYIKKEIKPKIDEILKNIEKILKKNKVEGEVGTHGTYTHFESKKVEHISDVDAEVWMRYKYEENFDKKVMKVIYDVISFLEKKYMLNTILTFPDKRFDWGFFIDKSGKVRGWKEQVIKTDLKKYLDEGILDKNTYENAIKYVVPDPDIKDAYGLNLALEDYIFVPWTPEEIKKQHKMHYGKEIYLADIMKTFVVMTAWVIPISDKDYISFDCSFRLVYFPSEIKDPEYNEEYVSKYGVFINERHRYKTNMAFYKGIFKNYAEDKYLKILKRIRSMLTTLLFYKTHNVIDNSDFKLKISKNKKNKIIEWREKINEITSHGEISYLNMLKNKFEIAKFLLKNKDEKEAKKIIKNIIPKEYLPKTIDEKTITQGKEEIMKKINKLVYPHLKAVLKDFKGDFSFELNI